METTFQFYVRQLILDFVEIAFKLEIQLEFKELCCCNKMQHF